MKKWIKFSLCASATIIGASSISIATSFCIQNQKVKAIKEEQDLPLEVYDKPKSYNWSKFRFEKPSKEDKLSLDDVYKYVELLVTILNTNYIYNPRSGIRKWNQQYRYQNDNNLYGCINDVNYPRAKLIWSKSSEGEDKNKTLKIEFQYDESIYQKATKLTGDESFNFMNDSINAIGNVFFRRLSLTSFSIEAYNHWIYPKIKKKLRVNDNSSYLRRCAMTLIVHALVSIMPPLVPFKSIIITTLSSEPINLIFRTPKQGIVNAIKHSIVMVLKYFLVCTYNTYASSYYFRMNHWNSGKYNEYALKNKLTEALDIKNHANKLAIDNANSYQKNEDDSEEKVDLSNNESINNESSDLDDKEKHKLQTSLKIIDTILNNIAKPIDNLISTYILPLYFKVANWIAPYINKVITFLFELFNEFIIYPIYQELDDLYLTNATFNRFIRWFIKTAQELKTIYTNVNDFIKELIAKSKEWVSDKKQELMDFIDKLDKFIEKIIEYIESPSKLIDYIIKKIFNGIVEKLKPIIDKIKNGKEQVEKIIKQIKQIYEKVKEIWTKYIKPILDKIHPTWLLEQSISRTNLNTIFTMNQNLRRYQNVR